MLCNHLEDNKKLDSYKEKITTSVRKILTSFDNQLGYFKQLDRASIVDEFDELCQKINLSSKRWLEQKSKIERLEWEAKRMTEEQKISDETKSDFLSIVSHQLRTPLTVILLQTELLLVGYRGELSDEQQESLQEILTSCKKTSELLNVFSIISKVELNTFAVRPKPLDLRQMIDEISLEFTDWLKQREVHFRRRYSRHLPEIKVDHDLARITFRNLLASAIKNTPPKGWVEIGLRHGDIGLYASISDQSDGIPVDDQPKIFTKNYHGPYASKDEWGGSGLDLYIAKTIIDKCHGKIWFETTKGKGTNFHIFLPL